MNTKSFADLARNHLKVVRSDWRREVSLAWSNMVSKAKRSNRG
jgi:hypothetical protein